MTTTSLAPTAAPVKLKVARIVVELTMVTEVPVMVVDPDLSNLAVHPLAKFTPVMVIVTEDPTIPVVGEIVDKHNAVPAFTVKALVSVTT